MCRFFDFTPVGILLSRFSSDMNFVDETIPVTLLDCVMIFTNVIGILALTVILNVAYLPVVLVLGVSCYKLSKFATGPVCRLRQIEAAAKSPIYSHLSTTLAGIATIRISNAQRAMRRLFTKHQDNHTKAYFYSMASSRWLSLAIEWLVVCYQGILFAILVTYGISVLGASSVGLLLSQTLSIQGPFQYAIRRIIEVESLMTSVQRIKDFSDIEPEHKSLLAPDNSATDDTDDSTLR